MATTEKTPASLLTHKQRKYLLGNTGIEKTSSQGRSIRTRIRSRVCNGLADFWILDNNLDHDDKKEIFNRVLSETDSDGEPGLGEHVAYKEALQSMIAFLYRETSDRSDGLAFGRLLERAIQQVEPEPVIVDFSVEADRSFEDLVDQVVEEGVESLSEAELRFFLTQGLQKWGIDLTEVPTDP